MSELVGDGVRGGKTVIFDNGAAGGTAAYPPDFCYPQSVALVTGYVFTNFAPGIIINQFKVTIAFA